MMAEPGDGISVHCVLQNMTLELDQLSDKLIHVEKILFQNGGVPTPGNHLKEMQDIDLIIQQVSDMGRALSCILESDLGGAAVPLSTFAERMHLNELRSKLIGQEPNTEEQIGQKPSEFLFFE